MRWRTIALTCWGLVILLSLPAQAAKQAGLQHGGNCVAYARAMTGIQIDGNAGLWWSHAAGRYDRGQAPKIGSILVFKSHGRMHSGHVAVVSGIVGPREILLDHANWVRGRVTKAMAAVDTSPNNDWTSVKVLGSRSEPGGQRDNPTFGFIYPGGAPLNIAEAKTEKHQGRHASDRGARAHVKSHREHIQLADASPVVGKPTDDVKPVHKHRAEPH